MGAGELLGVLKAQPPAALIIDLSRSPAQGRDLGVALRIHGSTRQVPLLFVEGEAEKVARVRQVLPDAIFTSWSGVAEPLKEVMARPPSDPVVPGSALAGYSGTPLPKKLGIKEGRDLDPLAEEEFGFSLRPQASHGPKSRSRQRIGGLQDRGG